MKTINKHIEEKNKILKIKWLDAVYEKLIEYKKMKKVFWLY